MPKLKIAGYVQRINGTPAADVQVEIWDEDNRSSDDRILTVTTDRYGRFGGRSKNWKDELDGFFPWDKDFLYLTFVATTRDGRTHTGPFIHLGPWVSVPILLPF
jgi:hypothetical protein